MAFDILGLFVVCVFFVFMFIPVILGLVKCKYETDRKRKERNPKSVVWKEVEEQYGKNMRGM